jgi:uncharacterized protein
MVIIKPVSYGIYKNDMGKGIFAERAYKKGALIVVVEGKRIKDTDRRLTHRGVQVARHWFIEPKRYSAIWFMNHSCAPNAYMDQDRLYARRAIRKGEEVTADYSLFTDFPGWDMDCACGAKNCRKLIVSFSKLPEHKDKRFVSSYLK